MAEGAPLLREYVGKTCIEGSNPSGSATRLRLRFGAASRGELLAKHRVPRHGCEAATAGWFELSPSLSASIHYRSLIRSR